MIFLRAFLPLSAFWTAFYVGLFLLIALLWGGLTGAKWDMIVNFWACGLAICALLALFISALHFTFRATR